MQDQAAVAYVRILVKMVDALGVEERGAPLDPVDDIALFDQEFGQVGTVLAGDAGDECNFSRNHGQILA